MQDSYGCTRIGIEESSSEIIFSVVDSGLRGHKPVRFCGMFNLVKNKLISPVSEQLPAPCSKEPVEISTQKEGDNLVVNFDVPGLVYWMLSRLEEITSTDKLDSHNRFPASSSHGFKYNYLERPIVDEWLMVVEQLVKSLWPSIECQPQRKVRILPSHDVDFPSKYSHCSFGCFLRKLAGDCIRNYRPLDALKGIYIRASSLWSKSLLPADPYNTFNWIMQQSELRKVKSQFYLMCGGKNSFDPGYDPKHISIRKLLKDINQRGHIIGLHPSYDCIDNPKLIARELDILKQIAEEEGVLQSDWGVRMHYLRCSYPKLWRSLSALGVSHDATMGYADHVGFRAGTAHSYKAFDAELQKAYKIEVRPLVVMEVTLYADSYMGLDPVARREKLASISDTCRKVGGDFSILWHNSELVDTEMRETYQYSLSLIK